LSLASFRSRFDVARLPTKTGERFAFPVVHSPETLPESFLR
jgi:hypothetical protein